MEGHVERVLGIGGIFFRAADPVALARWYRNALGVDAYSDDHDATWWPDAGPTVWAPFPADTDYFGPSGQGFMVNLRVRDLDAMLRQLRGLGATVVDEVHELAGVGRFGWAFDPEGNKLELWEPAAGALKRP
jgi:predicted enzyme related to lactoylglutathione lyase